MAERPCELGYTLEEVDALIGAHRAAWHQWAASGLTMTLCPEHGIITYRRDVDRFLARYSNDD